MAQEKKKKAVKNKVKKENFFKSVKNEMKLVKWPTGKEVLKNTIATIVLVVLIVVFFILLNMALSFVKGVFA